MAMGNSTQTTSTNGGGTIPEFDAIVIGAGVAGLYQLYKLRELGLSVRCLEDGSGRGWHLVLEPLSRLPL